VPSARINGIEIYYRVLGEGPRLLVFNGSGATIASSRPLLERLARQFTVLVHDQRGLGRSGIPDSAIMADYAADGAALLDHVGWETCAVFGISFGGMVAQEFAVTWPQRVTRLALLCTSPGGAGGSSYPLHLLADMAPEARKRQQRLNLDTRFTEEWLAVNPDTLRLVESIESTTTPETAKTSEQLRGERMQLLARSNHDVYDRLPLITCPTYVACGRYDGIAPPANSEAIHAQISGSRIEHYEGGHLFMYQDRRAWSDIVGFLASPE
jgi:pimeloyl-ACP methyl ester carboxylesterase